MTRAPLALPVLVLSIAFAVSPAFLDGSPGLSPVQFPIVHPVWPAQPVAPAFAIWGVIFVLLVAGASVGLLRYPRSPGWEAMRAPLAASLGMGVLWILLVRQQPLAATVLILFMAAAATEALLRAPRSVWADGPVGLYAGWLTASGCVAVAGVLAGHGVMAPQPAALLMLAALAAVSGLILWQRPRSLGYFAAVIWAYGGVVLANLPMRNLPVIALSAAAIALLLAFFATGRLRDWRSA